MAQANQRKGFPFMGLSLLEKNISPLGRNEPSGSTST
jgi:hypothetical protein